MESKHHKKDPRAPVRGSDTQGSSVSPREPGEIHVVLSAYNAGPFVADQIRSIQGQTHREWTLWIRDDGSRDDSYGVLTELAGEDPRIQLYPFDGRRLGAGPAFGWLLERLPREARYIFCSDADDVWLPEKMELTLGAMGEAEGQHSPDTPILLHTDLSVTDADLGLLAPSLWGYLGIDPEPASLRRLLVQNVVTGPTILMNRALLDRVTPIPQEAIFQDWWIALVAAALGRIVCLRQATVLYRRHASNSTGEYLLEEGEGQGRIPRGILGALGRRGAVRKWIDATAFQAGALLDHLGKEIPGDDRGWLAGHAGIPAQSFFRRKGRIFRHMTLREYGPVRNLGIVLRG